LVVLDGYQPHAPSICNKCQIYLMLAFLGQSIISDSCTYYYKKQCSQTHTTIKN
jgi:hypothetical protein